MQIYHYHNDHLGTPNELTNQKGEVVWLANYEAWGNTARIVWREEKLEQLKVSSDELQPIRFQGQSFDTETGLHYNRFRYFDPDLGMFISRDPIGLMGGSNVFQYAPNPTGWIDPLGLAKSKNPNNCDCDEEDPCKAPVNSKSGTQFGHAFLHHGKAKANSLKDTARALKKPQSYWTNDTIAANLIGPYRSTKTVVTIPIPDGLGKVILPDGTVKDATHAIIVPTNMPGKCLKTAYPIVK